MLVQRCVTPGAVGLVIAISGMSTVPSTALITPATVPLWMQCEQGYSGCIGVLAIGCHVASRSVAGLPSISPLRIAVIGRQKWYLYFASRTAMSESSSATVASAMKRAVSTTSMFLAIAIWRWIGCVDAGPVNTQNFAS